LLFLDAKELSTGGMFGVNNYWSIVDNAILLFDNILEGIRLPGTGNCPQSGGNLEHNFKKEKMLKHPVRVDA
jgi:hypothetical protein